MGIGKALFAACFGLAFIYAIVWGIALYGCGILGACQ